MAQEKSNARDAAQVKKQVTGFVDEVLKAGEKGFEDFIADDKNLQTLYGVLKVAKPDLVKDFKEFSKEPEDVKALRESLQEASAEVFKGLKETKEKLTGKNGLNNMIGMLTDAYSNDPQGVKVGAHLLGNMLNINPAIVQLGLQWLDAKVKARQEETKEGKGEGAEKPAATAPVGNDNEPQDPARGGEERAGGADKQQGQGITVNVPAGFSGKIAIEVQGGTPPVAERGEAHAGAKQDVGNRTRSVPAAAEVGAQV